MLAVLGQGVAQLAQSAGADVWEEALRNPFIRFFILVGA